MQSRCLLLLARIGAGERVGGATDEPGRDTFHVAPIRYHRRSARFGQLRLLTNRAGLPRLGLSARCSPGMVRRRDGVLHRHNYYSGAVEHRHLTGMSLPGIWLVLIEVMLLLSAHSPRSVARTTRGRLAPGWFRQGHAGQVRLGQVHVGQVRTAQIRTAQVRTAQFHTGKDCAFPFRAGQVEPEHPAGREPTTRSPTSCSSPSSGSGCTRSTQPWRHCR